MATLDKNILRAAFEDGLIPKRLTANQGAYLHQSVKTVNNLYWLIAGSEQGLDREQIEKATGLAANTVKQYCRWLIAQSLLYAEEYGHGGRYVYFTKKKHLSSKRKF